MRSRKTVLIILAVVISLCIIILVIGAFIVPDYQLASTYGIADKERSALVIFNKTSEFFILSIEVKGEIFKKSFEAISPGKFKTYILLPGEYSLIIHYSDLTSFSKAESVLWYVDGVKLADFKVKKGRAAIYMLKGGDVKGMTYDPPTLEDKSRSFDPEDDWHKDIYFFESPVPENLELK